MQVLDWILNLRTSRQLPHADALLLPFVSLLGAVSPLPPGQEGMIRSEQTGSANHHGGDVLLEWFSALLSIFAQVCLRSSCVAKSPSRLEGACAEQPDVD